MEFISYSKLRETLASSMDRVCDSRVPIVVTRQGAKSVVILSLEDYESLDETAYLLRSPRNASRLLKSIAEEKDHTGKVVSIEDLED